MSREELQVTALLHSQKPASSLGGGIRSTFILEVFARKHNLSRACWQGVELPEDLPRRDAHCVGGTLELEGLLLLEDEELGLSELLPQEGHLLADLLVLDLKLCKERGPRLIAISASSHGLPPRTRRGSRQRMELADRLCAVAGTRVSIRAPPGPERSGDGSKRLRCMLRKSASSLGRADHLLHLHEEVFVGLLVRHALVGLDLELRLEGLDVNLQQLLLALQVLQSGDFLGVNS